MLRASVTLSNVVRSWPRSPSPTRPAPGSGRGGAAARRRSAPSCSRSPGAWRPSGCRSARRRRRSPTRTTATTIRAITAATSYRRLADVQGCSSTASPAATRLADAVVIWTRATTAGAVAAGALDARARPRAPRRRRARARRVAGPSATTRSTSTSAGSSPAPTYHYGFEAGGRALAGRAHPDAAGRRRDAVRFATCSCAKFNAGYFNAYARIAERDDLDFLLHLGDYIYEAANKPAAGPDAGRRHRPPVRARRRVPDPRRVPHPLRAVPPRPRRPGAPPRAAADLRARRPRARRRRLGAAAPTPTTRPRTGRGASAARPPSGRAGSGCRRARPTRRTRAGSSARVDARRRSPRS